MVRVKFDTSLTGRDTARMARMLVAMLAFAIVTGGSAATSRADEALELRGEIVDLTCYLHQGSKGRRHRACAEACAQKGLPIGILTEDGDVLLLIEDHDNPDPYNRAKGLAGRDATIKGKKYQKGSVAALMVLEAAKQ